METNVKFLSEMHSLLPTIYFDIALTSKQIFYLFFPFLKIVNYFILFLKSTYFLDHLLMWLAMFHLPQATMFEVQQFLRTNK